MQFCLSADKLMKYYAKIVDIPQKYFRTSFKRIWFIFLRAALLSKYIQYHIKGRCKTMDLLHVWTLQGNAIVLYFIYELFQLNFIDMSF